MTVEVPTKLQLLLRAETAGSEVERVRRWCEAHGLAITGVGARTVSAHGPRETLERLFGVAIESSKGFAPSVAEAGALTVPEPLRDVVELIALVPRHDPHRGDSR